MKLDPERIRLDFPAFDGRRTLGEGVATDGARPGRTLVYLDSAATTQKPRIVLEAMTRYYEEECSNVHRGLYALAERATADYEGVRARVARFVGAPDPRGVVFTKNGTEALNLVAYSFARARLGPGDELLVSVAEHHSNLVPWQEAARAKGFTLRVLPLAPDGQLDLARLDDLLTPRTRLVAVTGLSNVLGTVTDLGPLVAAARAVGATVLVDGAQLVAHARVDVRAAGIDFLCFSGHKVYGPTGVGVLVARPELLEEMPPFLTGGEMVLDVTLDGARWNEIPHKFEAGTPPVAEALGLAAALDYLEAVGPEALRAHDQELVLHGTAALSRVPGLVLYGVDAPLERRVPIFAFNLLDDGGELVHPHDVATLLSEEGIAIRAGHHCARPLTRSLGVASTCRASCGLYSTREELDALAAALERARVFFDRR